MRATYLKYTNNMLYVLRKYLLGSTWAQEMVWLLGNKLDYEGASKLQTLRTPLLELTAILDEDHNDWLR